MVNLAAIDKDGTITKTISGKPFPEHPEDQQLIPGVAERLEELRSLNFRLTIVTNQGGCAEFEVFAEYIKPGMQVNLDGVWAKVLETETGSRTHLLTDLGRYTISGLYKARFKSVQEAIDETIYACKLAGIWEAYLCPSAPKTNGDRVIRVSEVDGNWQHAEYSLEQAIDLLGLNSCWLTGFRKPHSGMLRMAEGLMSKPKRKLMIGDRSEDEAAAKSAGFEFLWANDWISKGVAIDG